MNPSGVPESPWHLHGSHQQQAVRGLWTRWKTLCVSHSAHRHHDEEADDAYTTRADPYSTGTTSEAYAGERFPARWQTTR